MTPTTPAHAAQTNCLGDNGSVCGREHDEPDEQEPCDLGDRRDDEHGHAPRRRARAEVGEAPGEARAEREQNRGQSDTGRVAATASSWFAW